MDVWMDRRTDKRYIDGYLLNKTFARLQNTEQEWFNTTMQEYSMKNISGVGVLKLSSIDVCVCVCVCLCLELC